MKNFIKSNLSAILIALILLTGTAFANGGYALLSDDGEVQDGDYNIVTADAMNTVHVRSMSDFPTPAAGSITLTTNTKWIIDAPLTTADEFIIPTGSFTEIESSAIDLNTITYTDSGTLFTGTDIGFFNILNTTFIATDAGSTLYAINGSSATLVEAVRSVFFGFGSLGTVQNIDFFIWRNISALEFGTGLTVSEANTVGMSPVIFHNTVDSGDTYFTYAGNTKAVDLTFTANFVATNPNEKVIHVDPALPSGARVHINNNTGIIGGVFFESGSLDWTDEKVRSLNNSGVPDSNAFAAMYMIVNTTDTAIVTTGVPVKAAGTWATNGRERFDFDTGGRMTYTGLEEIDRQVTVNFRGINDAGINKDFAFYISEGNDTNNTITAFADSAADPGVDTTVTSAAHGLSIGDRVPITGTTNYNLVHTITRIVDANNFDIDFIFVANDATGNWARIIEESLSSNRFDTTDNKNTTVISIVEFDVDDYVEIFVQNNSDTTDFALDQAKFIIR